MKILLFGASGLLGSAVARAAARRGHDAVGVVGGFPGQVPGLSRQIALDLGDLGALERTVLDLFPDVVINCAAVSQAGDCEREPERTRRINVALPETLAKLSRHLFARLIHVSSDLVFDGTRPPYRPDSPASPVGEYARQKAASEAAVLERAGEFATVVRLPLLNGNSLSGTRSLHEALFAQWSQGKPASLFTDERRQPCAADNAADMMVELCERQDCFGLHHWAGSSLLSRYEIGAALLKHFGLPETFAVPTLRGDFPQTATRPENLALDSKPLDGLLKTRLQAFESQLDALVVPPPFRAWYNAF